MGVLLNSSLLEVAVPLALAILVAVLMLVLSTTLRRDYLNFWAFGWSSLAVHLALIVAVRVAWPEFVQSLPATGALAVYLFALSLLLGCRDYLYPGGLPWSLAALCTAGGVLAVTLPPLLEAQFSQWLPRALADQASFFAAAWSLKALMLLGALVYLLTGPRRARGSMGRRLFAVILAICLGASVVELSLLAWAWHNSEPEGIAYLAATYRFGIVFDLLSAFGVLILSQDDVRGELEQMNRELAASHHRLEELAHKDALTEVLNRHAFHSLLQAKRPAAGQAIGGSVAVLDLDRLKPINDDHGHAAGDAAIRQVAKAIRQLIRPDDLLFRWGGDEFLVVLPQVAAVDAEARFERLGEALTGIALPGVDEPKQLGVSVGAADFKSMADLEAAIAAADARMFKQKEARRRIPPSPHREERL